MSAGVIYAVTSTVEISNSVFISQVSLDSSGAIFLRESSLIISEFLFQDCKSNNDGGAVSVNQASTAQFTNGAFLRNSGVNSGGAIVVVSSALIIHWNWHTSHRTRSPWFRYLSWWYRLRLRWLLIRRWRWFGGWLRRRKRRLWPLRYWRLNCGERLRL